jgi:hypothetical protein
VFFCKLDEAVTSNVYKKFGYLHDKKNGKTVLKFEDNDKEKKILCKKGNFLTYLKITTRIDNVQVVITYSIRKK